MAVVGSAPLVDTQKYPNAQLLISRCNQFLNEIQDLTPGANLEEFLNKNYPPSSEYHQDFQRLCREGLKEGWIGVNHLDGPKYTRDKLFNPCEESRYCSITAVYMESEEEYSGQYHVHPYGEINCVIPVKGETPQLKGMQGWMSAGWTSPGPGTHHYPQAKGGAVIALFFLPAGRIAYNKNPSDPQPACV